MGIYVSAVWCLWSLCRFMGLQCGTYGIPIDLWYCGVGPMGFSWVYGIAVWELWDSYVSMGLRSETYGEPMGLRRCGPIHKRSYKPSTYRNERLYKRGLIEMSSLYICICSLLYAQ